MMFQDSHPVQRGQVRKRPSPSVLQEPFVVLRRGGAFYLLRGVGKLNWSLRRWAEAETGDRQAEAPAPATQHQGRQQTRWVSVIPQKQTRPGKERGSRLSEDIIRSTEATLLSSGLSLPHVREIGFHVLENETKALPSVHFQEENWLPSRN